MTVRTRAQVPDLRRRRWVRRLHALRPWLVAVAVLIALGGASWAVFVSSWLGVSHVEVVGTDTTAKREVTNAAGIPAGTPLARVDLAGVQSRVEQIPTVASASVERRWPQAIVVRVTERRPVAAVARGSAWWNMDDTGVVYMRAPQLDPDLPVVELEGPPAAHTLAQVAAVLRSLPTELLSHVDIVTASSMDSIVLRLEDGREVRWGSASESARKAAVLAVLLTRQAKMYDVSVPSHPATRN